MFAADIGHGFAIGFHDLEVVIINPDPALEVTLFAFDFLRRDVKDVAMQFVFLLLADVEDVVFGQIFCGKDEGQLVADVFHVFL